MPGPAIYWHTIRHLKPAQIIGRARHYLPRWPQAVRPAPAKAMSRGGWVHPLRSPPTMSPPGTFCFLNETHDLGWPIDWTAPGTSLLWRYNLHYFDDLAAADDDQRTPLQHEVIAQWIAANPSGAHPAWDPYPLSLRLVNWIKWELGGKPLPAVAADSMAAQARWLKARPEWHLLGNHLFANAKALAFAGCYFTGAEAERWLGTAVRILDRQLDEQVLCDGGNFELSPMYHAIFLADVLDLLNLGGAYPGRLPARLVSSLRERASAMLRWLEVMAHPDGGFAMFNDCANGVAADLLSLRAYAQRLDVVLPVPVVDPAADDCTIIHLEASGYARLACRAATAICDVGAIGPDYLPGHAHADSLSFELSVGLSRVIVNGGTSQYGTGEIRQSERGTPAHSTLTVNDADSSEVWGGFRVARRARPFAVSALARQGCVSLEGSHDGYRRLARDIVHRRRWTMSPGGLRVEDFVSGSWQTATARFILDAAVEVEAVSANAYRLRLPGPEALEICFAVMGGEARLEPAWQSLAFGKRHRTQAVAIELRPGTPAAAVITWADDAHPVLH
ncbi:heparinase II/III family protein [Qipengyuania sediminis]|uniref:heparinase II/III family protein n=1 Tax=Qipengyuania sediminis TaxID=1532023 RepID=UPI001059C978|nr:heparinase II/III family protein [Qipengyuania sediminis]